MVASLGDAFPAADREGFANRNIVIGAVLKTFTNHTSPPKEKRFIIVGIKGNSVGVIFINSSPNIPPKLLPFLYKLELAGREAYLDWESYADCNNIYEWGLDELKRMVAINPTVFLDIISDHDLAIILRLIKTSPNNDYKTLEKFGIV